VLQLNLLLCDLGVSRVKTDVTSRTTKPGGGEIVCSQSWMIPERLLGGDLKKPCDIWDYYAQMDEEQRRLIDEELWPRVTTFYLHVDQPLKPFLEVYTPGRLGCLMVRARVVRSLSQRNIVIKYYVSDSIVYPGSTIHSGAHH
jgi:serine/threonine protein kinase